MLEAELVRVRRLFGSAQTRLGTRAPTVHIVDTNYSVQGRTPVPLAADFPRPSVMRGNEGESIVLPPPTPTAVKPSHVDLLSSVYMSSLLASLNPQLQDSSRREKPFGSSRLPLKVEVGCRGENDDHLKFNYPRTKWVWCLMLILPL